MGHPLETSTEDSHFIFNNKIYSPINDIAMGTLLHVCYCQNRY